MEHNSLARFQSSEEFETYWNENYREVVYEDVKEAFEDFVTSAAGHIYLSDYEEKGCISKADFKANLSQEAQMNGETGAGIARVFHETFGQLYDAFLDRLFEEKLKER